LPVRLRLCLLDQHSVGQLGDNHAECDLHELRPVR
jgi:hypothetical protein